METQNMDDVVQKKALVKLHPEAKEISFKHKLLISRTFRKSILGNFGIDYFSLMIVDSSGFLSIYSSNPALEYHIIDTHLWVHDGVFCTRNHKDNAFYFWDELYSPLLKCTLKLEKEHKFEFQFGFLVMKKIFGLFVIYSFATKNQTDREVYRSSKQILSKIGDYFLAELKSVHRRYTDQKTKNVINFKNDKIKLVINNIKN